MKGLILIEQVILKNTFKRISLHDTHKVTLQRTAAWSRQWFSLYLQIIYLPIYLFIYLFFTYLFIYLFIYLLFINSFIYLFIFLVIRNNHPNSMFTRQGLSQGFSPFHQALDENYMLLIINQFDNKNKQNVSFYEVRKQNYW